MIKDLYNESIECPIPFDRNASNWDNLITIYNGVNKVPSITFENTLDVHKGFVWKIRETIGDRCVFELMRDKMLRNRYTNIDEYGLLGLSIINPKDRSVILTEGVSDYFSAKFLCPDRNVLGVTTLGGSRIAKMILVNMFDTFCICSDNDTKGERNTGLTNSNKFKMFLEGYNKRIYIFIPETGYKDVSDNLFGKLVYDGR